MVYRDTYTHTSYISLILFSSVIFDAKVIF